MQLGVVTNDSMVCTSEKFDHVCARANLSRNAKRLAAALKTYKTSQVLNALTWIDLRMSGNVTSNVLQRIKNIAEKAMEF